MKKFEIQYTSRYYEEKNYYSEIVSAKTNTEALKKFAKLFNIEDFNLLFDQTFLWDDGLYKSKFKCINEVKEVVCSHCNGSGKIYITD